MKRERKSAFHALWLFTLISILSLSGKPYNANGEEWMFNNILSQENNLSPYRDSSRNDILTLENSSAGIQDLFFNKLFLPLLVKNHKPDNNLLMRCEQGLFRSANGGDHWTMIAPTSGYLVANDFGNPGQVLWARPDGLWKSQGQGLNWTAVGPFGAGQGVPVTQLATTAGMSNIIYASFENSPGKITGPLYSLDGGLSWQKVTTAPWEFPNLFQTHGQYIRVALAPRAGQPIPLRLITAASASMNGPYPGDLYRSGDYGSTWAAMNFIQQFPSPPLEFPELYFPVLNASPVDPNRLYLGIYYYTNVGGYFTYGREGVLFTSADGGINWKNISPYIVDGADIWLHGGKIVASPIHPERIYLYTTSGPNNWAQSDNGGKTWMFKSFFIEYLILDHQDPDRLYGIDSYSNGFTSLDGGTTWMPWAEQPCGGVGGQSFQQLLAP